MTLGVAADLALLAATLGAVAVMLVYTLITGISPVPTTSRVRATMLALMPAHLSGLIFELGSGWGALAFALARRYPDARIVAFELSPVPWLVSRLRQAVMPAPNLRIHRADFMAASLQGASAVVCYLYPGAMERLEPKFAAELAPGTPVVSNTFALPGWRPAAVRRAGDLYASPVYLYYVAAGNR